MDDTQAAASSSRRRQKQRKRHNAESNNSPSTPPSSSDTSTAAEKTPNDKKLSWNEWLHKPDVVENMKKFVMFNTMILYFLLGYLHLSGYQTIGDVWNSVLEFWSGVYDKMHDATSFYWEEWINESESSICWKYNWPNTCIHKSLKKNYITNNIFSGVFLRIDVALLQSK